MIRTLSDLMDAVAALGDKYQRDINVEVWVETDATNYSIPISNIEVVEADGKPLAIINLTEFTDEA